MSFNSLLFQALDGLAAASGLFFVAAGLSLIFGVTRIINIAHGSLYMLGTYVAATLANHIGGALGFWGGILTTAVLIGLIGAVIEVVLLRRIYRAPELFQLLATFALVLVINDATLWTWGPEDVLGPRAPGLRGAVEVLGRYLPSYDVFLIAAGPVVLIALHFVLTRTRFGRLIRAATQDREMLGALGVNQALLFTSVFALGSLLSGLGGALQIAREPANLLMDLTVISDAFVVVVVGGMGSIPGAYLAAVVIAEVKALCISIGVVTIAGVAVNVSKLTLLPLLARNSPYALVLGIDVLIAVLFAASLHFIMGPGGMHSFGHAAYFGLGAYAAALLVKWFALSMPPALIAAPVVALLGAALFGWFAVRLSGVYLAMLTLAFAQIVWSIVFQWSEVTGGSNGVLGIWPTAPFDNRAALFWLTAALTVVGILLLRTFLFAPFGYAMRAGRDSPLRAEAIGIDVKRVHWIGFTIAGAVCGVAGGVFAFAKGSISPETIDVSRSINGLVMVLLGGIQTLSGPIVGASVFALLQDTIMRQTEYWRALLGGVILLLVLAFPAGIVGGLGKLGTAWRRRP